MTTDKTLTTLLFIGTIIIAGLLLLLHVQQNRIDDYRRIIENTDTTTTVKHDTIWKDTVITEKELVPVEVIKKKVDTVYTSKGDTLHLTTESKLFHKRLTTSKDTADLQIYTTGINTSLDSLKWRLKTHQTHTTEIVEIIKYEQKKKRFIDRFHIGLQVGYGLGLKNKDFEPYIGFGGSMDL